MRRFAIRETIFHTFPLLLGMSADLFFYFSDPTTKCPWLIFHYLMILLVPSCYLHFLRLVCFIRLQAICAAGAAKNTVRLKRRPKDALSARVLDR